MRCKNCPFWEKMEIKVGKTKIKTGQCRIMFGINTNVIFSPDSLCIFGFKANDVPVKIAREWRKALWEIPQKKKTNT